MLDIEPWALERIRVALYRFRETYIHQPDEIILPAIVTRIDKLGGDLRIYGCITTLTDGYELVVQDERGNEIRDLLVTAYDEDEE